MSLESRNIFLTVTEKEINEPLDDESVGNESKPFALVAAPFPKPSAELRDISPVGLGKALLRHLPYSGHTNSPPVCISVSSSKRLSQQGLGVGREVGPHPEPPPGNFLPLKEEDRTRSSTEN